MSSTLKTTLKILFFVGLGVVLIWLVVKDLKDQDIAEIKNAFSKANYSFVIFSIIIGAISHLFRALRWNQLMEPIGAKPPLRNTFLAVVAGYMANLAIPRLGEFTRCALLNRYDKAPLEATIGTVITERIIDTLTMFGFLGIVLLTQFELYKSYLFNFLNPLLTKFPALGNPFFYVVILLGAILVFIVWRYSQKNKKKTTQTPGKIMLIVQKFLSGISSVTRVRNKSSLLLYSLLIWVCYLATAYVNFWALPETSQLGIDAALAILVWGSFGFIFTQGGLGAYQLIAMQVFALYGVSQNIGFALGWIIWTAQTLVILIFGALAFILFPIVNKNHQPDLGSVHEK